jgi:hypothetical protein
MTPRDFCYWLQGAIEVTNIGLVLKHTTVIQAHLELVRRYMAPNDTTDASTFCLCLHAYLLKRNESGLSPESIRISLSRVFQHEIDPSFNDTNPADVQSVHD